MNKTQHLKIYGRVQGVGFRVCMQREAAKLDVNGWVRNRSDGSVEAVVQGDSTAVGALVGWARHGPRNARVSDLKVEDVSGEYAGFEVRPTE